MDRKPSIVPSLPEHVTEAIKDRIIDGTYAPGSHLVEADLASDIGISRGPIREALRALAFEGWVDLRPRQGAFVHRPSVQEIRDFFAIRELLEVEAARLAALEGDEDDTLGALIAEVSGSDAQQEEEEHALFLANARFHAQIVRLGGNLTLRELWGLFSSRMRWYYAPLVKHRTPRAWDEHKAIAEAIRRNDAEEASRLMREHVSITAEAYEHLSW